MSNDASQDRSRDDGLRLPAAGNALINKRDDDNATELEPQREFDAPVAIRRTTTF
jgi:hypothetical protein